MMEDYTSFQLASMVLLGLATTCMAIWAFFGRSRPTARFPPGPRSWPVIGNMPLMSGAGVHRKLAALAKEHNTPLLSIRLGTKPALVACNAATARQFLQTHDSVFGNRPEFTIPDRILFGIRNNIGFQDTCDRWRELRKTWTTQLLSQSQVSKKRHIRREEVAHMIATIRAEAEADCEPLDIAACMSHVTSNIMGRLVLSERILGTMKKTHPLHAVIDDTVKLLFTPLVGEFVPLLSFLDAPVKRRMEEICGRTERVLGSIVDERLRLRSRGARFDDILDLLLDHTRECVDSESRDFINATLLEMFLVGVDTSANTMSWAVAELLANPEEMRMVQEELEEVVGMGRMVEEEDIPKLKYLRAVVKEVFRLHPVAVMMIPHSSNQDCLVDVPALPNVRGTTTVGTPNRSTTYLIPSGTRVFINLWAIGTDEHTWDRPHAFTPARFLDSDTDVKGQHFELLPFGSGRRMCPGLNHGLRVVEVTLANLLHCFHWSPATSTIDLSESKSTSRSLVLATPPLAFPKFRLHTNII